jgi:hypothetical protein
LKGSADAGSVDGGSLDVDGGTPRHFSFLVTSLRALQDLSGKQVGFGGDLRFGESGPNAGLRGADKICAAIAESSMPGSSAKQWRAFLSAADDGTGQPVHAIARIGAGPWYDRLGRLLANTLANLHNTRPLGSDPAIVNDLPNEDGVPNHAPDPARGQVDNHDMLTGTNDRGQLYSATSTCLDWTSNTGDIAREGRPRVGHSWPRDGGGAGGGLPFRCAPDAGLTCDGGFGPPFEDGGAPPFGGGGFPPPPGDAGFFPPEDGGFGPPELADGGLGPPNIGAAGDINSWMSSLDESGCAPGVNLIEMGGPQQSSNTVGSGGGYGGFYCFALTP